MHVQRAYGFRGKRVVWTVESLWTVCSFESSRGFRRFTLSATAVESDDV